MARKKFTDKHHIVPQSRIPDGKNKHKDNIVEWDRAFHRRWHAMFTNMTVEEIHQFIDIISTPNERFTASRMHRIRQELKEETKKKARKYPDHLYLLCHTCEHVTFFFKKRDQETYEIYSCYYCGDIELVKW